MRTRFMLRSLMMEAVPLKRRSLSTRLLGTTSQTYEDDRLLEFCAV
jgi:hypothetical protein